MTIRKRGLDAADEVGELVLEVFYAESLYHEDKVNAIEDLLDRIEDLVGEHDECKEEIYSLTDDIRAILNDEEDEQLDLFDLNEDEDDQELEDRYSGDIPDEDEDLWGV